jgi:hypothetical protein
VITGDVVDSSHRVYVSELEPLRNLKCKYCPPLVVTGNHEVIFFYPEYKNKT